MAFKTYTEAFAALVELNARCLALAGNAPRLSAGAEAHEAYAEKRRALRDEAEAAGFVGIFDGTYKLSKAMVALPE
jgi:hypothetical protein